MTCTFSVATGRPGRCRRALHHGVLALALACSGAAEAYTLDALLRLPLERLLALRIDAQRLPQAGGVQPAHGVVATRGTHAH